MRTKMHTQMSVIFTPTANNLMQILLKVKQGGSIGIVVTSKWYEPLTNSTDDCVATERALSFEVLWYFLSFENLHFWYSSAFV